MDSCIASFLKFLFCTVQKNVWLEIIFFITNTKLSAGIIAIELIIFATKLTDH